MMIQFPKDPVNFSVAFVRRLRMHRDIKNIPSVRQSISIVKLLLAKFERNFSITLDDYIKSAVFTTPIEDQFIARDIAWKLLYQQDLIEEFNAKKLMEEQEILADLLGNEESKMDDDLDVIFDELSKLREEINYSEELVKIQNDFEQKYHNPQQFNTFFQELEQKREIEPFKDLIDYLGGLDNIAKLRIGSMEELKEIVKNDLLNQCLEQQGMQGMQGSQSGQQGIQQDQGTMNDQMGQQGQQGTQNVKIGTCSSLQQKLNLAERLNISSQMYQNSQDPLEKFVFGLQNNVPTNQLFSEVSNGNLSDFLSKINSAKEENLITPQNVNEIEKFVSEQLAMKRNATINDYKEAALSLGKKLDSLLESSMHSMVENSIQSISYPELMSAADFLDTNFGSDFIPRLKEAYEKYSETLKNLNFNDLISNPNLSGAWRNAINEALQRELNMLQGMSPANADYQFSDLQKKLQSALTQNPDIHTNDFLKQIQGNLSNNYMQTLSDPVQFMKNLEQLKNWGANFDSNQMLQKGKSLNIPEDQLMEIFNPGFEFIQNMIQNGVDNFERYQKALGKMKLSSQQIENLASQAVSTGQPLKNALSALANKNLKSVLESIEDRVSESDIRDVLYGLGAGAGEGLITQWFLNRDDLSKNTRQILKEYIKNLMFELGAKYANMYMGTAESGPITQNRVRTYEDGDDPDLIDMEETLQGILESGKQIRWIENDDFMVSVTEKGLRSVCMELDISGSMSGEKLSYMAICTAMMVLKMDIQELAISMFESNLHVIKDLDESVDQDKIADEVLEIEAMGGTVIRNAIDWAQKNFKKHVQSKIKINIMFTDAEVFDIEKCEKKLKEMVDDGVQFIFVVPKFGYSGQLAEKLREWTDGIILSIENWKDFPEQVSKLIK